MGDGDVGDRYIRLLKVYIVPLGLGVAGLIFFGYGLIQYFGALGPKDEEIVFETKDSITPEVKGEKIKNISIVVDIEGAVVKPGVYTLSNDSRMEDALAAAGGMSEEADYQRVAKYINLASTLADGAKIYIPYLDDDSSNMGLEGASYEENGFLKIKINSASSSELDSLPGVGLATADKIIGGRPYGDINELIEKKIVGAKVFEQIKNKIDL